MQEDNINLIKYQTAEECMTMLNQVIGNSICEIGCWIGIISRYIKKINPRSVLTGIEASEGSAKQAKKYYD